MRNIRLRKKGMIIEIKKSHIAHDSRKDDTFARKYKKKCIHKHTYTHNYDNEKKKGIIIIYDD